MRELRRALWICDYFPRPHDLTTGTWALETAVALQDAGLPVVVLAPTPWIPGPLGEMAGLGDWSQVPDQWEVRGVTVYYPRCPHYPSRRVREGLYRRFPVLDTEVLWPWLRSSVREILRKQPFEISHANFLFPSGHIAMRVRQRHGVPFVAHERSVQRLAMARENPRRRTAYRRILRAADAVITENERMASELRQLEPALSAVGVFKQPGFRPGDAARHSRKRPSAVGRRPVVLSVGALSERKGHAVLVRAIAEIRSVLPGVLCRIVGEGPERERLKMLVDEHQLVENVEFVGRLAHAEVLSQMSWCDVFALPSWGEAGGTVYGEAMQFGKPVIGCRGEGIAELVRDGVHGHLVPSGDVRALAEALVSILADGDRRERMGASARALAERALSYPAIARDLIALYQDVLHAD